MDDSAKGRYEMILGRYPLKVLGLTLKWSGNFIEADDGPFKGYLGPMVDMCMF